ncbi:hypothetical protein [Brassicibacter mesophilus]|uniref:hypothetical protein n=1 Tax=Brassicibacter mesophilus TaxID=745119 RepID=UPI003D1DAEA3
MKNLFRKKSIIAIFIFILIIVLYLTRIIPSGLCMLTAIKHVNDSYPDMGFKYKSIEYFSVIDDYLVYFVDKNGYEMALTVSPLGGIIYDPLNPPG